MNKKFRVILELKGNFNERIIAGALDELFLCDLKKIKVKELK